MKPLSHNQPQHSSCLTHSKQTTSPAAMLTHHSEEEAFHGGVFDVVQRAGLSLCTALRPQHLPHQLPALRGLPGAHHADSNATPVPAKLSPHRPLHDRTNIRVGSLVALEDARIGDTVAGQMENAEGGISCSLLLVSNEEQLPHTLLNFVRSVREPRVGPDRTSHHITSHHTIQLYQQLRLQVHTDHAITAFITITTSSIHPYRYTTTTKSHPIYPLHLSPSPEVVRAQRLALRSACMKHHLCRRAAHVQCTDYAVSIRTVRVYILI